MKHGTTQCGSCGSRFTYEDFELVESMPADVPCLGCERLYVILAESSRRRALMAVTEPSPILVVNLSAEHILGRLLEARRRRLEPEPFDAKRAAAGERD